MTRQKAEKATMTSGPLGQAVLRLAVPATLGNLSISLVSVVDTIFMGTLGPSALAAAAFVMPLVMLSSGVAGGIATGLTSLLATQLGEGTEEARSTASRGYLVLALVHGVVMTFCFLNLPMILLEMGAQDEVLTLSLEFGHVALIGAVLLGALFANNGSLRAAGDTLTPGISVGVASFFNLLADWVLIDGKYGFPSLGLAGLAWATVIGWGISVSITSVVLLAREKFFSFDKSVIIGAGWKPLIGKLCAYSIPSMCGFVLRPLANAMLVSVVAGLGVTAVAALAVVARVEQFLIMVGGGTATVLAVLVAANVGARNPVRIRGAFRLALTVSMILGPLSWLLMTLNASAVARLFTAVPEVQELIAVGLGLALLGSSGKLMEFSGARMLTALKMPIDAILLSIISSFGLALPLAALGGKLFGAVGVFAGLGVAGVLVVPIVHLWLRKRTKGFLRRLAS